MRALLLALALLGVCARADSLATHGLKVEPTVGVAGKTLRLNGTATEHIRQGAGDFAVSLYLLKPAHTTQALLDAPGPKRICFSFLRTVQAETMNFLTRGVQSNMDRAEFSKTFVGVLQLGALLGEHPRFAEGESLAMDFEPGVGTTFIINGKPQGAPVKEPEFFKAMLLIWLGPMPEDREVKAGLLAG